MAKIHSHVLLDALVKDGYRVSLETSGSIDISEVNPKVSIVMDLKTPSSDEQSSNRYHNVELLQEKDQLKFVIGSRDDFDWAVEQIKTKKTKAGILFSPVFEKITPIELADWILENQINVRLPVQLHKRLWGDQKGK